MNQWVYCGMSKELYRKSVGRRIRFIRLNRGETMEEFSKHFTNAKSGTVSNWETGRNAPNKKRLNKIAELGGMTVEELINANPLHNYSTEELQAEINRRKKAERQLDLKK